VVLVAKKSLENQFNLLFLKKNNNKESLFETA